MAILGPDAEIVITGGTGFVGGAIARSLREKNYRVRLASRRQPSPEYSQGFAFSPIGDLSAPFDWGPVLDGARAVVHAAGAARQTKATSDAELFRINVDATERLARAAQRAGVEKFILISSVRALAGAASASILNDASPPCPEDAYGRSKHAAEEAAFGCGPPAVALRPVVVHGAGAGDNFALLTKLALSKAPLPFAALRARRSIVSDANVADAVAFCLANEVSGSTTFLVSDSESLTIGEICAKLRSALNRPPHLFPLPENLIGAALSLLGRSDLRRRLSGSLVVSCSGLEALGWRRGEASEPGLARMIQGAAAR